MMIECYRDFVRILKKHNFITDKFVVRGEVYD